MGRYSNTKLSKNKKNITKLSTTIYEDVPKLNTDIYVITQEGDRLDNLAFEYYQNQNLWWFIARANNLKTMNIPAGTKLRIPSSVQI